MREVPGRADICWGIRKVRDGQSEDERSIERVPESRQRKPAMLGVCFFLKGGRSKEAEAGGVEKQPGQSSPIEDRGSLLVSILSKPVEGPGQSHHLWEALSDHSR